MTSDTQLDRTSAPLASVSEQTCPDTTDPFDAPLIENGRAASNSEDVSETPPTNTFEGFGSFSG
ncbi:hypothetical protein [Methylobacterium gnaphalii]|uniref:Uncharacterized protein n=1 Tax=Methylobacterium gnaphalii TaxID=1010610 RepID=A0A512JGY5_9HYPH|nr:hypothetical protein [Methylobacterium gnaphalii]GEP09239.1 hypothetical protein MGN01_10840 [Methylobacterium gnaphalii]GJD67651.1 hypothetical protein MMMDOFMJ_0567 [Methylobacterium gnaphalii]GLS49231.1 hypothetical protein GCM10007885_20790 [Methylobacterium gnaphalii]